MNSNTLLYAETLTLKAQGQLILDQVSLSIDSGEWLLLAGPNGAGKSSLISLLLGLNEPDEGRVVRRQGLRLAYVPQRLRFDPNLPVSVERFLRMTETKPTLLHSALKQVGCAGLANTALTDLSGGELQRVLLARAILQQADLLVLDEPMQGVDENSQQRLLGLLQQQQQAGRAILMVSHDLAQTLPLADRVVCLEKSIRCQGSPAELREHPYLQHLSGINNFMQAGQSNA